MDIFCSLSKTPESPSNQEHYLSPADYILLRSSSLFGAHSSVQVAVFGSIASICLLSFKPINPPSNWLWHLIKPSLTIVFSSWLAKALGSQFILQPLLHHINLSKPTSTINVDEVHITANCQLPQLCILAFSAIHLLSFFKPISHKPRWGSMNASRTLLDKILICCHSLQYYCQVHDFIARMACRPYLPSLSRPFVHGCWSIAPVFRRIGTPSLVLSSILPIQTFLPCCKKDYANNLSSWLLHATHLECPSIKMLGCSSQPQHHAS